MGETLMQQRRVNDEGLSDLWEEEVTVPQEKAPAKYVPAAAVIRMGQALSGIIGRKECVGGYLSARFNLEAQPHSALRTGLLECRRGKRNSQCSGEMRRYWEEHRWRRRLSGL